MNSPDSKLIDLIHVEKGLIPSNICSVVIKDVEQRKWDKHHWYTNSNGQYSTEETKELDVQFDPDSELQIFLCPILNRAAEIYHQKHSFKKSKRTADIMSRCSPIRFNRYSDGQIMRQHHDHIHSIFDGVQKGIPVLSFIFNFNDDYEGADLYFWEDTVIPLSKGDVVVFPSLFLFPHGVTEIKKGVRYSGVSWSW